MEAVFALVFTVGLAIFLGFFGNLFSARTGFPEMLFLIFLGFLLGPIFNVFNPTEALWIAPYLATLALVFIMFDGGVAMDIYSVLRETPRALFLAVLSFALSVLVVACFARVAFGFNPYQALLLGAMCGGSSSIVVLSLTKRIKERSGYATLVELESTVTDVLCVVVALMMLDFIVMGGASYAGAVRAIAQKFSIGAVVGIALGIVWLWALRWFSNQPYAYMLTLGYVLLAYLASESLGGSGALCCLLLGLVLGNEGQVYRIVGLRRRKRVVEEGLLRFEEEFAFLVRSLFFVYLGVIAAVFEPLIIALGVLLSLILLATRFFAVYLATAGSPFVRHRIPISIMYSRGLSAAVLATLPLHYGLEEATTYLYLVIVVIVTTAIVNTVGLYAVEARSAK